MKIKKNNIRNLFLTVLVLILCEMNINAQIINSFRTISGDGISLEVYKKDFNNNLYIAGGTYGSTNFTYDSLTFSIGYSNLFIGKIDSLGSLLWLKFYSASEYSKLLDINIDLLGNIYTCGTFNGNLVLDSTHVYNSLSNSQDGILMKLDSSGELIWSKASFSPGNSGFLNLIVKENDLYVSNQYSPEVSFDTLFLIGDQNYQNTTILKLDTSGNISASKNLTNSTVNNLKQGVSSNLYFSGTNYRTMTFDSLQFPFQGPGWSNIYLMKLDSNLNFINYKIVSYPLIQYYWNSQPRLTISNNETIYLGGYFDSLSVVGDTILNTTSSSGDVFLTALDSSLNFKWSKKFGGFEQDLIYDLILTGNEKLLLCTGFNNITDFDGITLSSMHGLTMLLNCLDTTGAVIWSKYNQQGFCGPTARIVDLNTDRISLLGSFSDTLVWDNFYNTNGGYFILGLEDITNSMKEPFLKQNQIVVYPNPTSATLNISNISIETELLIVYDDFGNKISTKRLFNEEGSIILNGLKDGIYMICTYDKRMVLQSRQKFVVCR